jgi:hypothetical protein
MAQSTIAPHFCASCMAVQRRPNPDIRDGDRGQQEFFQNLLGLALKLQIERSVTHHSNVQRVYIGEYADALH